MSVAAPLSRAAVVIGTHADAPGEVGKASGKTRCGLIWDERATDAAAGDGISEEV